MNAEASGTTTTMDDEAGEPDGGEAPTPRDAAEQARRIDRLRRSLLAVEPAALKRAVLALPAPSVESLAKAARVRVPVLRAGSIKSLRRVDDPVLLDLLAGLVADDCLGAIRDRLGDDADDPTPEALAAAVDEVTEHEFPAATVRLTLAMVAAGLAEASDNCDALLDADARFAVPDEVEQAPVATVGLAATATASEEKRAARRARQAEEAERRRLRKESQAAAAEARKADRKRGSAAAIAEDVDEDDDDDDDDGFTFTPAPSTMASAPSVGAGDEGQRTAPALRVTPVAPPEPEIWLGTGRRRPVLTGEEASRFNPDDELVGSVVIAEIVFDPENPDQQVTPGAKRRPCVVIGASPTYLLVRPGYSEGGARSRDWTAYELKDWRAAGLDRRSWIEAGTHRVDRFQVDEVPLGRLTDDDWNALW